MFPGIHLREIFQVLMNLIHNMRSEIMLLKLLYLTESNELNKFIT